MIRILVSFAIIAALCAGGLYTIGLGTFGEIVRAGSPVARARPADVQTERGETQTRAAASLGAGRDKQIVFGDLHVHTGFSPDAFSTSLPVMMGEGASTVADACDFARFCSALDFFSINDHAEGATARTWQETIDSLRQCNAVASELPDPDLVAFLGWEWTQMGTTAGNHWGHRNIVLRDLSDDAIPARPIASASPAKYFSSLPSAMALGLLPLLRGWEYNDLVAFQRERDGYPTCPADVPVRELPSDCREYAAEPRELLAKLADWGYDSLVIPHGTTWGMYTPPGASWDKQIEAAQRDPTRQRLVEVYSGHGNSEEFRSFREIEFDANGTARCPEATASHLPGCQRAARLIFERCTRAGEPEAECNRRAAEAQSFYLEAGTAAGHLAVPGARPEEWLDAGQCRDCFQPSFNYRPQSSVQYMLALRDLESGAQHALDRFHFGFIGSSDTHTARAGSGYKEFDRIRQTDSTMQYAGRLFGERPKDTPAEAKPVDLTRTNPALWLESERSGSFFVTGGLAAAHTTSRARDDIYAALARRETYATSGPRILLWLDLVNPPDDIPVPMGGRVTLAEPPVFQVTAIGSLEQLPGCPDQVSRQLTADRLQRLCANECYHPSDVRRPISRIEVVRIRPRQTADEAIEALIEDPWRVLPCDGNPAGCSARFSDPSFASTGRDSLYYVRAIEAPIPTVNGDPLRCTRDPDGACRSVDLCRDDRRDDCLAPNEPRAWSSPIYIDYDPPKEWPVSRPAPAEVS
ncbi:MAG: DUF3604 domain-containing protein [Myxococcota bacterium]|nr:DUF3604 domain-containing protein [Myxococcota bacterium]